MLIIPGILCLQDSITPVTCSVAKIRTCSAKHHLYIIFQRQDSVQKLCVLHVESLQRWLRQAQAVQPDFAHGDAALGAIPTGFDMTGQ